MIKCIHTFDKQLLKTQFPYSLKPEPKSNIIIAGFLRISLTYNNYISLETII